MASRQRADFGNGFCHLEFTLPLPAWRRIPGIGWRIELPCRTTLPTRSGQFGPGVRESPTSISDQTKWQTKALSIAA
jgi:hypothetical protein